MEDKVLEYLEKEEGISPVVGELMLEKLTRYKDIYEEFCFYLDTNIIPSREDGAVEVESITARDLIEQHNVKVMGAYTFLISLRDDAKTSLEQLEKGLPSKDNINKYFDFQLYWGAVSPDESKKNYIKVNDNSIQVKYKNILKVWHDDKLIETIRNLIEENYIHTFVDILVLKDLGSHIKGIKKMVSLHLGRFDARLDCSYDNDTVEEFFYSLYKDISELVVPYINGGNE